MFQYLCITVCVHMYQWFLAPALFVQLYSFSPYKYQHITEINWALMHFVLSVAKDGRVYINGPVQNCGNSSALTLELSQFCAKKLGLCSNLRWNLGLTTQKSLKIYFFFHQLHPIQFNTSTHTKMHSAKLTLSCMKNITKTKKDYDYIEQKINKCIDPSTCSFLKEKHCLNQY